MRILHVGPLHMSAGGPALSMYYTALGLKQRNVEVSVLADNHSEKDTLIGTDVEIYNWTNKPFGPANYMPTCWLN